jgi:hypothetical protein
MADVIAGVRADYAVAYKYASNSCACQH